MNESTSRRIAESDDEILACWSVMRELRPHVPQEDFVSRVRKQERDGYRLAYISVEGKPIAVAGYRFGECLSAGRFMYVDDLVTAAKHRSDGHGKTLLTWLAELAAAEGCAALTLDSGVQRTDAHRFYLREGMIISGHHFSKPL